MLMQGKLLVVIKQIRFSYWFLPTLMAIVAAALALSLVTLDRWLGGAWPSNLDWLTVNGPEGARALLSTIAGSMITVAGVTFSITVAAVASATNNFGPLLVTSFLQDRGNQVTLGVFIATFLYCLLVLQTVANEVDGEAAFVPQIALLVALALTLASIGVLIFFIHHVPQSVHISHLVAGVGRDLLGEVDRLFPQRIGEGAPEREDSAESSEMPARFAEQGHAVPARGFGYVQQIEGDHLIDIARSEDLVIRIEARPGSFVRRGRPLATVLSSRPPDDQLVDRINATFTWGVMRSPVQDVMFLVSQLVQIAGRALSPGVNDPQTAMTSVDWLSSALIELAQRETPSPHRVDAQGKLRVIAEPSDFAEFVEASFGALRGYISADRNAALHAMDALGLVAAAAQTNSQRAVLRQQAMAYRDAIERHRQDGDDSDRLSALFARIEERCALSSSAVPTRHG